MPESVASWFPDRVLLCEVERIGSCPWLDHVASWFPDWVALWLPDMIGSWSMPESVASC